MIGSRGCSSATSLDESHLLQTQNHLMDCRWRHPEIALHVSFCRRTPVDLRVVVDEGEVLTLLGSIGALHRLQRGSISINLFAEEATVPGVTAQSTLGGLSCLIVLTASTPPRPR